MEPRARMKRFLAGEKVDRIPNGLGGCETAGMHILAYDKLKNILGVDDPLDRKHVREVRYRYTGRAAHVNQSILREVRYRYTGRQ